MTKEEVIRMARDCGHWSGVTVEMNDIGLERFAALVAAHEREQCAKVCEEYETENDTTAMWLNIVADAIRARGEMK